MNEAFTQLFAIGPLWVAIHCAGMCGPILTGVDVTGMAAGGSIGRGLSKLVAFQLGKALIYTIMGCVAGMVGQQWIEPTEKLSAFIALTVGILMGSYALRARSTLRGTRGALVNLPQRSSPHLRDYLRGLNTRLAKLASQLARGDGLHHSVALGMAMAFLPCMLPLWVLGLAAVSSSPWVGMGLMLSFSAMTGLALFGFTVLPSVAARKLIEKGILITPNLLLVSATWFVMIGLAGLDLIEHLHVRVGGNFVMMFW